MAQEEIDLFWGYCTDSYDITLIADLLLVGGGQIDRLQG